MIKCDNMFKVILIILAILTILSKLLNLKILHTIILIIFSLLFVYKIQFAKEHPNFKDLKNISLDLLEYILSVTICIVLLYSGINYLYTAYEKYSNRVIPYTAPVTLTSTKEFSKEEFDVSNMDYKSSISNQGVVISNNNSNITLHFSTLTKLSGDSTDLENVNLYGLNALYLATSGTTNNLISNTILDKAKGSVAIISSGQQAVINLSDSKVTTLSSRNTPGLIANQGGTINANNITLSTKGRNSPALWSNTEDGTINIQNSHLETNSSSSPLIKNNGNIILTNVTGTANASQILESSGGTTEIYSSTLMASGQKARNDSQDTGLKITSSKENILKIKDSSINISSNYLYYNTAPLFLLENTNATINIENTFLNTGSNILFQITNSNTNLTLINMTTSGNLKMSNSKIYITLESTTYTGCLVSDDDSNIEIKLDKNSTWILTADTIIDKLDNEDETNENIKLNGYKLTIKNTNT